MKLATAYIEISARTESFRRQLREAQTLAAESARNIGRTLNDTGSIPRDERPDSAERNVASAARFQPTSLSTLSPREGGSSATGDTTFWKQQLELQRKQLEVLQKQLELLKELRQGVPAVLT